MTDITVARIPVDRIRFHPFNVRRDLGDLRELTDSIRRHGVLQPIVVERLGEHLQLRMGHRRVAAARLAGVPRVPAVVHPEPLTVDDFVIVALHENLFRQDLSDTERRESLQGLIDRGMTRSEIAEQLGVHVGTVTRWLTQPTGRTPQALFTQPERPPTRPAGEHRTGKPPATGPYIRARLRDVVTQWQTHAEQGLTADQARMLLAQIRDLAGTGTAGAA